MYLDYLPASPDFWRHHSIDTDIVREFFNAADVTGISLFEIDDAGRIVTRSVPAWLLFDPADVEEFTDAYLAGMCIALSAAGVSIPDCSDDYMPVMQATLELVQALTCKYLNVPIPF